MTRIREEEEVDILNIVRRTDHSAVPVEYNDHKIMKYRLDNQQTDRFD